MHKTDLNKAVLCGKLQQTGLGCAPGTPQGCWNRGTGWGGGLYERVWAEEKNARLTGLSASGPP